MAQDDDLRRISARAASGIPAVGAGVRLRADQDNGPTGQGNESSPTVTIHTGSETINGGSSRFLNATVSGSDTTRLWTASPDLGSFADSSSTDTTFTAPPATENDQVITVTLTATNDFGSGSASIVFTVRAMGSPPPPPIVRPSSIDDFDLSTDDFEFGLIAHVDASQPDFILDSDSTLTGSRDFRGLTLRYIELLDDSLGDLVGFRVYLQVPADYPPLSQFFNIDTKWRITFQTEVGEDYSTSAAGVSVVEAGASQSPSIPTDVGIISFLGFSPDSIARLDFATLSSMWNFSIFRILSERPFEEFARARIASGTAAVAAGIDTEEVSAPTVAIHSLGGTVNGGTALNLSATATDAATLLWTATPDVGTFAFTEVEDSVWTAPAGTPSAQTVVLRLTATNARGTAFDEITVIVPAVALPPQRARSAIESGTATVSVDIDLELPPSDPRIVSAISSGVASVAAGVDITLPPSAIFSLDSFDDTGLEVDTLALITAGPTPNIYIAASRGGTDTPDAGELGFGDSDTLISRIGILSGNAGGMDVRINHDRMPVDTSFSTYFTDGGWDLYIQTASGVVSAGVADQVSGPPSDNFIRLSFPEAAETALLNSITEGTEFLFAIARADRRRQIASDISTGVAAVTAGLDTAPPPEKPDLLLTDFDDSGLIVDALALIIAGAPPDIYVDASRGGTDTPNDGNLDLGDSDTLISRVRIINNGLGIRLNDNDLPSPIDLGAYLTGSNWQLFVQTTNGVVWSSNITNSGVGIALYEFNQSDTTVTNAIEAGDRVIIAIAREAGQQVASDISSGVAAVAGEVTAIPFGIGAFDTTDLLVDALFSYTLTDSETLFDTDFVAAGENGVGPSNADITTISRLGGRDVDLVIATEAGFHFGNFLNSADWSLTLQTAAGQISTSTVFNSTQISACFRFSSADVAFLDALASGQIINVALTRPLMGRTRAPIASGVASVTAGLGLASRTRAPIASGVASVTAGLGLASRTRAPIASGVASVTAGLGLASRTRAPIASGVASVTAGLGLASRTRAPIASGVASVTAGLGLASRTRAPIASGVASVSAGVDAARHQGIQSDVRSGVAAVSTRLRRTFENDVLVIAPIRSGVAAVTASLGMTSRTRADVRSGVAAVATRIRAALPITTAINSGVAAVTAAVSFEYKQQPGAAVSSGVAEVVARARTTQPITTAISSGVAAVDATVRRAVPKSVGSDTRSGVAAVTARIGSGIAIISHPRDLEAIEISYLHVSVMWIEPEVAQSIIVSYEVSVDGGAWIRTGSTMTVYQVVGLDPGTTHSIRVRALSATGTGDISDPILVRTLDQMAPSKPTDPNVVSTSPTTIELSWGAPINTGGSDITAYDVEIFSGGEFVERHRFERSASFGTVRGLLQGREYQFRVRAINGVGASEVTEFVSGVPLASVAVAVPPGQRIPLQDADRQSLIVRINNQDCRITVWWQPSDDSWYGTLEVPTNTAAVQGRRLAVNSGLLDRVDGILPGNLVCRSLSSDAPEPLRNAWAQPTHALIWEAA